MHADLHRSSWSKVELLKSQHPLIHHITNYVVMNLTANMTLAIGASPVMAHAIEEIEEMTGFAQCLVINIGTLSNQWIQAMYHACDVAYKKGTPIVLDPVGAGATRLRTEVARNIVSLHHPTVIRGNASEIASLLSDEGKTKGVDSTMAVDSVHDVAKKLAIQSSSVVAVTGKVDFVTDGKRSYLVKNGHELLTSVTGTGCSATAIIAAFTAVHQAREPLALTVAQALAFYGLAAEYAARDTCGPASFGIALIDWIYRLNKEDVNEGLHIEEY